MLTIVFNFKIDKKGEYRKLRKTLKSMQVVYNQDKFVTKWIIVIE